MAFSEQETAAYLELIENQFWKKRRPPLHLRSKVREGQRISGQTIELFCVRPTFQKPGHWHEEAIAKARYVRTRDVWRVFWQRADFKWYAYPPCPEVKTLAQFLALVHEDEINCFFG